MSDVEQKAPPTPEKPDVVRRLRCPHKFDYSGREIFAWVPDSLCQEAADEIERLREALKPFADAATVFEHEYGHLMKPDTGCNIKFSALCRARAALEGRHE